MLNVHLSYKPPSSWRMLFRSGERPGQFSCLKKFRSLMVPSGGFRKWIIIRGILTSLGVLPNGRVWLIIKGGVEGASFCAPRQSNSLYGQTFRKSIYDTRWPEHPHLPIRRYKQRPQGSNSRPCYTYCPESSVNQNIREVY